MPDSGPQQQLLHLVIGGELIDLENNTFKDLDQVDIVGVFPNYATAYAAWRAKAQATVDNAQMRYFVVHLHRLLDPERDQKDGKSDHLRSCFAKFLAAVVFNRLWPSSRPNIFGWCGGPTGCPSSRPASKNGSSGNCP